MKKIILSAVLSIVATTLVFSQKSKFSKNDFGLYYGGFFGSTGLTSFAQFFGNGNR